MGFGSDLPGSNQGWHLGLLLHSESANVSECLRFIMEIWKEKNSLSIITKYLSLSKEKNTIRNILHDLLIFELKNRPNLQHLFKWQKQRSSAFELYVLFCFYKYLHVDLYTFLCVIQFWYKYILYGQTCEILGIKMIIVFAIIYRQGSQLS